MTINIGARLREARKAKKMSMSQVGSLIGVSHQQIQKYETGKNRVTVDALIAISNALQIKASIFFDEPAQ